ncbi:hypothetical protein [Bombilactobacillus thymidiniphilus]|uniref:DUF5067 domain-containing protein n=1 Tax=Bombilactobacillus thymidiniphilus TaxID=2923363 RepID=A0ABY4PD30_9LACO|nr:hypothetical protein [Bombilactobacillus thymidiniphilus]UQS83515.1 hypothetical protein MOO47_07015 [Bombilactobacillus thymidiniphilus]
MNTKLGIVAIGFLSLGLLIGCSNTNSKPVKSYKAKITSSSVVDNNWNLKGTTNAPDNSKILVLSNYNDATSTTNDANSTANVGESIKGASWAKVKHHKFEVQVDTLDSTEDQTLGSKAKVLVIAVSNYNKSWENDDFSTKMVKWAKNNNKPVTLTVNAKQAKYYASLGDYNSNNTDTQKNQNTINSNSEYPDITNSFDVNNMSQYSSEDLLGQAVTLTNFYVKDIGADKMKQYHLLLTPTQNSDQYFLAVTDKLSQRVKLGDIVSIQGPLNGKSKVNDSQINSGISENYFNKPITLIEVDKIQLTN